MRALIASATILCLLSLPTPRPAAAQPVSWNGWARCALNIRGPGYVNTETHTWIVSGATPTTDGSGTWSVVGSGRLDQGNPAQTSMHAEWTINANAVPGGRFRVVIDNNQLAIRVRHAQLRQSNGISGFVQQTISNKPRTPTPIASTQYEWSFPAVRGPATSQTLSGSTPAVPALGGWGTMRASGSTMTASCSWSFANGATPSPPPALPAP
jgi:hypothetical protein